MFERVEAFYRPASVREALRLLQSGKGQARVVAGGTDVVVEDDRSIRILIDITHAGLNYIRQRGSGYVIGATTTMAELEESPLIQTLAGGMLASAAATCGSVQIRNLATIGGNMSSGSPAADLASPLLALEATAVVADEEGQHKLPLAEFLAHRPTKSLLVELAIPAIPGGDRAGWCFQKMGRTAIDISIVNVAAGIELDARRKVKWARIGLGAVAPVPMRAFGAEKLMVGREFDHALLAEVGEEVAREVQPVSDIRASAEYRREISRVLTERALEVCAGGAGCTI